MSNAPPQSSPENPQQVLRFTAGPVLDEAIVALEREGDRHGKYLPDVLFLYSMKRIELDRSGTEDDIALNESQFGQYRKKVFDLSGNGLKEFSLDANLHEIKSGGQSGDLVGVGFRVRFSEFDKDAIIAPPLYGSPYRRSAQEQDLNRRNAEELLEKARKGGYIPIYYRIGRTIDNPGVVVERLRSVLRLGMKVTGLAVVPLLPRVARETNIYQTPPMQRTYKRVDEFFAEHLDSPLDESDIHIFQDNDQDPDSHFKNAS